MRNEDPWSGIAPSPSTLTYSGRLCEESRPHELFRGIDHLGRRLLFLVHGKSDASSAKLPEMAGLIVEQRERSEDDQLILSVKLESEEDADIFARLSEDIIEVVASSADALSAAAAFVQRTWKWHSLLKGKRKTKLSREAQLGLIGELWTLKELLAPRLDLETAITSWRGSEGAPKDFELSRLCIECKSRGASSRSKIRITSEHQLDDVPGHHLVLAVHAFAACDLGETGALTLHGIVEDLLGRTRGDAPQLFSKIEMGLDAAGYDLTHDYEVIVSHRAVDFFKVERDFPRIVPGMVPDGPEEIRYDLPLNALKPFKIEKDRLFELLVNADVNDD